MFISDSMTKKLVTVRRDTTIFEARNLMVRHEIRHLPVVSEDGRLIGMVTDRDIRSALPRDCVQQPLSGDEMIKYGAVTTEDIMSTELIVVEPTYTLQDALLLFQQNKVGALPVVDDTGKLKGIVSVRDLMRAFINVMGLGEPGSLLGILVDEEVGQLKKIVDAVTQENISFGSILVARYWDKDKRAVFPYLLTNNVGRVKKRLTELGYTLLDPMDWYLDRLPDND